MVASYIRLIISLYDSPVLPRLRNFSFISSEMDIVVTMEAMELMEYISFTLAEHFRVLILIFIVL